MCPLDETHIEAAHRDVSHVVRCKGAASVAFKLARLRLDQNLTAFYSGDAKRREVVRRAFLSASSIVRMDAQRQKRLVREKRASRKGHC